MRDVKDIREALARELANALTHDLENVFPWKPKVLGATPCGIIHSLASPLTARPGSLQVTHRFELEVVIALPGNIVQAMETFTSLVQKVLNALHRDVRQAVATNYGVTLQTTDYRQAEVVYGGQTYITLVIGFSLNDVEGESFEPS